MSNTRRAQMKLHPFRLVPLEHPALHAAAAEIEPSDEAWLLGCRLVATALRFHGLAVAAPQVGVTLRVIGMPDAGPATLVANPKIVEMSGEQLANEGCLSMPGRWFRVKRADLVVVEGIHPRTGDTIHLRRTGIEARCWQHELDHLNGVLISEAWEEVQRSG